MIRLLPVLATIASTLLVLFGAQDALASAESELQKARDAFEYGDYERARQRRYDAQRRAERDSSESEAA